MPWYESTAFFTVVAAIGSALITGVITVYVSRKARTQKRLVCKKREPISLVNISDRVKNIFDITYNGERVESAYFFYFSVENSGNTPIKNQPVQIELDTHSKIIDSNIITKPKKGFGNIAESIENNELSLNIDLMNPRDKVDLEILALGTHNPSVQIGLKNEGVKVIEFDEDIVKKEFEELPRKFIYTMLGSIPLIGTLGQAIYQSMLIKRGYER